jgi:hypothetical protein
MPTNFCEQESRWNDGVDEHYELVRPPATTLAPQVLLVDGRLLSGAPMNSADKQPASLPRALAIRRWGTTHRSNRREVLLVDALRRHFLRFASLEVVKTIAGWARGRRIASFRRQFSFRFSGPFQRVDVSAPPLPQSFPVLSQCVGKRVRRHIEKRELVAAAVGFPTHRHIEEGVGSRRMRFRGHVGHSPCVPCRLQPTIDAGISRTA